MRWGRRWRRLLLRILLLALFVLFQFAFVLTLLSFVMLSRRDLLEGANVLSAALYELTLDTVTSRERHIDKASTLVAHAFERARLERAATVKSWAQVLAPVAGVSVVAGLLGAFATVADHLPTDASPAWIAAVSTAASLFIGAIVGIAIERKTAD